MRRTSMQLAAAVLAGGLAVTACGGSAQARRRRDDRPGPDHLGHADQSGRQPDRGLPGRQAQGRQTAAPGGQAAQQVLTWLITFQVFNKLAQQHGISVTPAQVQNQLTRA